VFVLARQSLVDTTTVLIALGAFALTWVKWKLPDPVIVAAAALIGLVVKS
jgi:chromate transporter